MKPSALCCNGTDSAADCMLRMPQVLLEHSEPVYSAPLLKVHSLAQLHWKKTDVTTWSIPLPASVEITRHVGEPIADWSFSKNYFQHLVDSDSNTPQATGNNQSCPSTKASCPLQQPVSTVKPHQGRVYVHLECVWIEGPCRLR
jgi:hypothetical protein